MLEENFQKLSKKAVPNYTYEIGGILYFLAKMIDAKNTVEIGTQNGYVSLVLAFAAKENNGKHYTVDNVKKYVDDFNQRAEEYKLKNYIKAIHKNSAEINWRDLNNISDTDEGIDLAFVDGNHSKEGVKADIRQLSTSINPGGFLCFHDRYDGKVDVYKAISELYDENKWEELNIPYSRGLTIWKKK